MSRAPELELIAALEADATLMATFKAVYHEQADRAPKFPFLVVQLIGDTNEKHFLSAWGGEAAVQIDIYARTKDAGLRATVKDALRRIRGATGGITVTAIRVSNELANGITQDGMHRYTIDATIDYTE